MNLFLVIRFLGLLFISLFAFSKALNIKQISKFKLIATVFYSFILSIIASDLHYYEIIFVCAVFIFAWVTVKEKKSVMFTAALVSVSIALGIDVILSLILGNLLAIVGYVLIALQVGWGNVDKAEWTEFILSYGIFVQVTPLFVSAALIYLLFKTKRLRNGFLFLKSGEGRFIGIVFSIMIVASKSFITFLGRVIEEYHIGNSDTNILVLFFVIAIAIYLLGILFWWRSHTTLLYRERIQKREITDYQQQIERLLDCNEFLSKSVHRDNKLVPAMYNAVSNLINNPTPQKSMAVLKELDEIMEERKEIILKIQKEHKPLPSTKIERIDAILNYMKLRAADNGIIFDFSLAGSVNEIVESKISKQDIETLLSDLIENAIIAASQNKHKKILVTMGISDNYFELSVHDSGIPFGIETLRDLGLKKSTTHADEGGSGIGYTTIFEILNKYHASLNITEQRPEDCTFVKIINIRFDKKFKHAIYSFRANEIKLSVNRPDMSILDY